MRLEASVVRRTFVEVDRAVVAVRGLFTVLRPPSADTRLGDCGSLRLEATNLLALADVALAADVRLTDEPSVPT